MRPMGATSRRLRRAGPGLALALGLVAPSLVVSGAEPPTSASAMPTGKVIYHNSRAFRIPFNIEPEERARIKEVLLCVSEDQGQSWKPVVSRTTPDKRALAFRAPQDGEYWFAVQTLDNEGRLYPPVTAAIEPKMRVVVDTDPPTIALEAIGRSREPGVGPLGCPRQYRAGSRLVRPGIPGPRGERLAASPRADAGSTRRQSDLGRRHRGSDPGPGRCRRPGPEHPRRDDRVARRDPREPVGGARVVGRSLRAGTHRDVRLGRGRGPAAVPERGRHRGPRRPSPPPRPRLHRIRTTSRRDLGRPRRRRPTPARGRSSSGVRGSTSSTRSPTPGRAARRPSSSG